MKNKYYYKPRWNSCLLKLTHKIKAIDYNTGISSLETGAPEIKYTGDEGPKSPQEEMQIAGGEYNRVLEILEKIREGGPLSEDE